MGRETIEDAAATVVDPVVATAEQAELLEGEPDPSDAALDTARSCSFALFG